MVSTDDSKAILQITRSIYESRLRAMLERDHLNRYVAIEPYSGDFFIGDTMGDAIDNALEAYPNCVTHTIRIGHPVVFELMAKDVTIN